MHPLGVIPFVAPGASELSWWGGRVPKVRWGRAPPLSGGVPCTHTARERPRTQRLTPLADETERALRKKKDGSSVPGEAGSGLIRNVENFFFSQDNCCYSTFLLFFF